MPYNLAFFGVNKGVSVTEYFPEVESWYIGGHSLGGAMAASCASSSYAFDGVVLLAAYSTSDVTDLRVLSVYGNKDQVLNMANYNDNKKNLPAGFDEFVINGGNHAYFGMYDGQDSNLTGTVSNEEQIRMTAQYIFDFITE